MCRERRCAGGWPSWWPSTRRTPAGTSARWPLHLAARADARWAPTRVETFAVGRHHAVLARFGARARAAAQRPHRHRARPTPATPPRPTPLVERDGRLYGLGSRRHQGRHRRHPRGAGRSAGRRGGRPRDVAVLFSGDEEKGATRACAPSWPASAPGARAGHRLRADRLPGRATATGASPRPRRSPPRRAGTRRAPTSCPARWSSWPGRRWPWTHWGSASASWARRASAACASTSPRSTAAWPSTSSPPAPRLAVSVRPAPGQRTRARCWPSWRPRRRRAAAPAGHRLAGGPRQPALRHPRSGRLRAAAGRARRGARSTWRFWTEAALYAAAGIDAVVFGPGDIAQAHAADEFVELAQLETARDVVPAESSRSMMEPEVIQRFLESVGQKADVDLYLKLFRAQEKESFAIIAADAQMVRTALDPFHFDLRILAGIGLYPVVLLGLFDAKDADRQAQRVYDWLVEDQVPGPHPRAGRRPWPPTTSRPSARPSTPTPSRIVSLEAAKDATTDGRFNLLSALAARLGTRKVIFLSPSSGLEREGAPHISLRQPVGRLRAAAGRPRASWPAGTTRCCGRCKRSAGRGAAADERGGGQPAGAAARAVHGQRRRHPDPQGLAHREPRQLRRGSIASRLRGAAGVGLRQAARRSEAPASAGSSAIYVEENYLGAALLSPSPGRRLPVEVRGRAHGPGRRHRRRSVVGDDPRLPQRSSGGRGPTTPSPPGTPSSATAWHRFPDWHVFWRGLPPERGRGRHRLRPQRCPPDFVLRTARRSPTTTVAHWQRDLVDGRVGALAGGVVGAAVGADS